MPVLSLRNYLFVACMGRNTYYVRHFSPPSPLCKYFSIKILFFLYGASEILRPPTPPPIIPYVISPYTQIRMCNRGSPCKMLVLSTFISYFGLALSNSFSLLVYLQLDLIIPGNELINQIMILKLRTVLKSQVRFCSPKHGRDNNRSIGGLVQTFSYYST